MNADALDQAPEPSSSSLRLVATLTAAGALAGLLLASVYAITLPTIEANAAAAVRRAVFEVVPGTASMQKLVLDGARFVPADGSEAKDAIAVYAAYDQAGKHLGFAIQGQGRGFQDTIKLLYGYDPTREGLVGMQVLDSRETPGLGDRIGKDPSFAAEFAALAVAPEIVVVKHGTGSEPCHVDGITGATISSKAVVRILNERNRALLDKLPKGDDVPPAPATQQEGDK
ncbi:MAG: FMN-binding protein [Planctomycetes bacterium]|nr:FMN-binding protein [Planctomycetota bacterium]